MAEEEAREEPAHEGKAEHEGDGKKKEPPDEKRRQQVIAAAGVAVVILTIIIIRRGSSSAAAAPLPVTGGSNPALGSYAGGVSPSDYANLNAQVQGLSAELASINATLGAVAGSSSPTGISSNPNQTQTGSGFGPGSETPVYDFGGSMFEWLPNAAAGGAAVAAGEQTYFQPTPGHFTPAKGGGLAPDTPQFVKVG